MSSHNNKINVLFLFIQMDIMGGSERLVYNIIRKIDRRLFAPSVGWFFGNEPLADFKALDVPLYHIPKIERFDISTMRIFAKIIRDNNIHIVNAHHFMSLVYSFYGCKLRNRIKLIYTEHSGWEIEGIKWKWRKLGSHLLNHVDFSVGVSPSVTRKIVNKFHCNRSRVITILNGVDIDAFAKQNEYRYLKRELGIAENDRVIGIAANLKKVKNHILLLKAFSELVKAKHNIRLIIIGRGMDNAPDNTEKDLREFVHRNGLKRQVTFLGYRNDMPDLLSIIDIFCLTSKREGLPLSLIEAMAAGIPVVGTDVDGIRDVIIHNRSGFLVPLDDVQALTDRLYELLEDASLRQRLGQYAKLLAREMYSLDKCVNEYQNLFLSLVKGVFPDSQKDSLAFVESAGGPENEIIE